MKKCMALFLTAAMILTGTLVCACAEGDRPLDQQVEDRLHASIQHETDSPEWVGELAAQQDGPVTQLFVVAALGMDRICFQFPFSSSSCMDTVAVVLSMPKAATTKS